MFKYGYRALKNVSVKTKGKKKSCEYHTRLFKCRLEYEQNLHYKFQNVKNLNIQKCDNTTKTARNVGKNTNIINAH